LKVGDQVLLQNETGLTKLDFKCDRPYTVDKKKKTISNIRNRKQKLHKNGLNYIITCSIAIHKQRYGN